MINLTGKRFGRLTVTKIADRMNKAIRWLCICDCGVDTIVWGSALRRGLSKSCGCLHKEKITLHGYTNTKTFRAWNDMKMRCSNKNNKYYKDYGGRGIKVCRRWKKFKNFLKDMGEAPPKLYLDRIDNDGNYNSKNCRWCTSKESAANRRNLWIIRKKTYPMQHRNKLGRFN